MPGLNQTGQRGTGPMSGRGFGTCRANAAPAPEPAPARKADEENELATQADLVHDLPVCGIGRGGIPCGCGRGNGFGGGKRSRGKSGF